MKALLSAVVLAFIAAATAAAAGMDRRVDAHGPVTLLAASGSGEAWVAGAPAGRCPSVWLWDTDSRGLKRVDALRSCPQTSTGSGIAALATTGDRVLWLQYAGGNIREWSLMTATLSAHARTLRFLTSDPDAAAPIVVGRADEDLLPYAVGRTVVTLAASGARRFVWTAPARVTQLGAGYGHVAVALADGRVFVLTPAGAVEAHYSYAPGAVKALGYSASGVLVHVAGRLEIRKGSAARFLALPADARFAGFKEGVAAYTSARGAYVVRLATGKTARVRTVAPVAIAQLARRGLAYSSRRSIYHVAWIYAIDGT